MEECYGVMCELRNGDKCLHPDVVGRPDEDNPGQMIQCPKVKYREGAHEVIIAP
jgi:hypothetical protein